MPFVQWLRFIELIPSISIDYYLLFRILFVIDILYSFYYVYIVPSDNRLITTSIVLTDTEVTELTRIAQSRSEEARLVERARIILLAAQGVSNIQIAQRLTLHRATPGRWRQRYVARRATQPDEPLRSALLDQSRPGAPDRIKPEQDVDLLALATTDPKQVGVDISHWSSRDLARHAPEKIGLTIDHSTVSRFLASCQLQPHRVKEWMNRKDDPEFEARATHVKAVLAEAVSHPADPHHVTASFDEKTGVQALERIVPDKPMQPGRPVKREFEYQRHGTLTLLALMVVNWGRVLAAMKPDRTNVTTADVLKQFFQSLFAQGYLRITIVLDQLNTHMSIELVQTVALLCNLPVPDLALLKTMEQRRAWLEQSGKPIVFLFTPKHASWLNPIELWFGVLSRKVLRRGSFSSTTKLQDSVENFIRYYNEKLAHPYRLRHLKAAQKAA